MSQTSFAGAGAWWLISSLVVLGQAGCGHPQPGALAGRASERPPNVVVIFTDDQGYGDVGVFGAKGFGTPNLDRMATEGMKLNSLYVPQAVCSASRAALMTGSYPNRISISGALTPSSNTGIAEGETTIAELAKSRGYQTAIFGKWHLGHHPQFLPTRHGFDEYFGLPYSNDMGPLHPVSPEKWPPLPLIQQETVLEHNPDQTQLTTWYTERAVSFIERNREHPFFLYVPHSMPHVPLFVSDKWKGKTERGLYGDVIAEIDWSVGEILAAIKRNDLDDNTLVIFTADNGPWLSYGNHGGSAGPLREGKATAFDGGVREPAIARWPGKIPAGRETDVMVSSMDLLPTIARLIGAPLPEHTIDGKDIWPILSGAPGAKTPHEALYFFWGQELHAVRSGPWKLHLPHPYRHVQTPGKDGLPGDNDQHHIGLALFNVATDLGESHDVAAQHPDIVAQLQIHAERARADLGDTLTGRQGSHIRAAGQFVAP